MTRTIPTFIIAGVGKSGSSSLWHYLKQHPEVSMAEQKEPLFFTDISRRREGERKVAPPRDGRYQKGWQWYQSLYQREEGDRVFGEASVSYFYCPDAPAKIETHVPEIRLIFIFRQPVDRLHSHYWQARKAGYRVPDQFEQLVRQDHPLWTLIREISHYKNHLSRFLRQFDRKQMKFLFFDDLIESPQQTLRSVYRFLEIRPDFLPSNLGERFNPSADARFPALKRVIRSLRTHPIKRVIPESLVSVGSKALNWISELNNKEIEYPPMSGSMREQLIEEFSGDIEYLEEMTGRDLTKWKT